MKKNVIVAGFCFCMLFMVVQGCGKKSDLEKFIGAWQMIEPDGHMFLGRAMEFYEPNEKDSTTGNLEYTLKNSDTVRKGEYHFHESSGKVELALYDEFGVLNDYTRHFTFTVEFNGDNEMIFEDEDSTFVFSKMDY